MAKSELNKLSSVELQALFFSCAKLYRLTKSKTVKAKAKITAYTITKVLEERGVA